MKDAVIQTVELPLFVKNQHELASLLKKVKIGSALGIDLLIKTVQRPDEEVTLKVKLQIAEALVDMEVKITDQINKDQITRQLAEIKVKGLSTPLGQVPGDPRRLPPKTDFNTIQEV